MGPSSRQELASLSWRKVGRFSTVSLSTQKIPGQGRGVEAWQSSKYALSVGEMTANVAELSLLTPTRTEKSNFLKCLVVKLIRDVQLLSKHRLLMYVLVNWHKIRAGHEKSLTTNKECVQQAYMYNYTNSLFFNVKCCFGSCFSSLQFVMQECLN